jgi:hypothetical protein
MTLSLSPSLSKLNSQNIATSKWSTTPWLAVGITTLTAVLLELTPAHSAEHPEKSFTRTWSQLPLNYELPASQRPWVDPYWPDQQGGIARRWNAFTTEEIVGFGYHLYTQEELIALNAKPDGWKLLRRMLSPAEKWDIVTGRVPTEADVRSGAVIPSEKFYPTVHEVWSDASPNSLLWEGICNGFAAGGLAVQPEPAPAILPTQLGFDLHFGSSDLKAVAALYFDSHLPNEDLFYYGNACGKVFGGCNDFEADQFHILITNMLGLRHQGFVLEQDASKSLSNVPVFGFSSKVISQTGDLAKDATVHIQTTVKFTRDSGYPTYVRTNWDLFPPGISEFEYTLTIRNGQVVDGQWLDTKDERPDFAWSFYFDGKFRDHYTGLENYIHLGLDQPQAGR